MIALHTWLAEVSGWLAMAVTPALTPLLRAASPPPVTRDGAAAAARDELSKRAYHRNDPSLVQRALQWLLKKAAKALDAAANHAPGHGLGLLLLVVLLLLLVAVVGTRIGKLRRTPHASGPLFGDEVLDASDHRQRAEQFAAAQQWAQAVREWLRAITRELEQRGVLDPRPGRTADELRDEVSAQLPGVADDLRRATSTFDAVWYGGRPAGPDDAQLLRSLDRRLAGSHRDLTGSAHRVPPP